MKIRSRCVWCASALGVACALAMGTRPTEAAVGDLVHQITVPVPGSETHCSIGLAFDGTALYYDRCNDSNIYLVDPLTGALLDTFDTGIPELPNAMAFDGTRNGLWIGAQRCDGTGMPIYFWDFDDDSVALVLHIPFDLVNPATGESFLALCFTDGLAFNAGNVGDPSDDEIWFSDDVNRNVGRFRLDGTLIAGYDALSVDPSLVTTSGLAIGGDNLYLANNGGGDVFRADRNSDPLVLIDQFTSGDTRQEDMECDPLTFAPIEVMWVRTTPQSGAFPDVVTAFEIEPATCGLGGQAEICDNGIDDDGDDLVDHDDPDCQICGNGYLDPGEACDDGNTVDGDGCSSTCTLENLPPVAICEDVSVPANDQCLACASVDGGSYDPDGPPWTVVEDPGCDYPLGTTEVMLTITDPEGASDWCTGTITVVDVSPPLVSVDPMFLLWPPNHEYHAFQLSDCATVVDNCCGARDIDEVGTIVSICSDEPEDAGGGGDGHTNDDAVILGPSSFEVRSERKGGGNGRVYSVTFVVSDASGNITEAVCQVGVPHDASGDPPVDDGAAAGYCTP